MRSTSAFTAVFLLTAPMGVLAQAATDLPHLRAHGAARQLVVDGRPMLILGGELGNSTASSLEVLSPVWPKLGELNLNAVLVPVYWELVEPEEGQFEFALVDGLLAQARSFDMRLVLLWFGSWKNSMSSYVPSWVKRDSEWYPRARTTGGTPLEILSPFSDAAAAADARAFEALMAHLRAVDGDRHTVVMVQVENEIGMIPEARDHSPAADSAFRAPVPSELTAYLETHREALHLTLAKRWAPSAAGSWTEVFGDGIETEELFMAWHFARYVERVAAAGKSAYPLPMYVNAALIRPGRAPGEYPSAGPLPHLVDVWRAGAPSIDFLAPDIYFPNFVEWAGAYDLPGNPLFIPEAGYAGAPTAVADALYAIGELDAIGFNPFSIEDLAANDPLGRAYGTIASLADLILDSQGSGRMKGVRPQIAFDGSVDESPQRITLGDFVLNVTFIDPWTPRESQRVDTHGGLVVTLADDTFLVVGTGITITFAPSDPASGVVGIERIEEGAWVDGAWRACRVLNGDQSHQGRHLRLPPGDVGVQRVTLYRYR